MIHNLITYGTGGGLVPELVVTAPNGSTVTANALTPTSTIVGTTTTDYIFHNIPLATYSVVATLEAQSKTESITVSEVKQCNLEIVYATYLYDYGNQVTSLTGGWKEAYDYDGGTGTVTFDSDHMRISCYRQRGFGYGFIEAGINSAIDITNFNSLKALVTNESSNRQMLVGISTESSGGSQYEGSSSTSTNPYNTIGMDISSYSGLYYPRVRLGYTVDTTSTYYANVYQVWLE